ncbi:MAG: hypothetical protein EP330_13955 [Deltaproteobacteria bacterium]|nr:MAG: hypothetical protein EP330_13955 [Deltaproteobacteria bacterium]
MRMMMTMMIVLAGCSAQDDTVDSGTAEDSATVDDSGTTEDSGVTQDSGEPIPDPLPSANCTSTATRTWGGNTLVTTRTYDSQGFEATAQVVNTQGSVSSESTFTHDVYGVLMASTVDYANANVQDKRSEYTYDSHGSRTAITDYDLADGTTHLWTYAETFTYDSQDRQSTATGSWTVVSDATQDYTWTSTFTWSSDSLQKETLQTYSDETWTPTHFRETFDAEGRLVKHEADNDNDGTWDTEIVHTYLSNGLNAGYTRDNGIDGTVDMTEAWEWSCP